MGKNYDENCVSEKVPRVTVLSTSFEDFQNLAGEFPSGLIGLWGSLCSDQFGVSKLQRSFQTWCFYWKFCRSRRFRLQSQ